MTSNELERYIANIVWVRSFRERNHYGGVVADGDYLERLSHAAFNGSGVKDDMV